MRAEQVSVSGVALAHLTSVDQGSRRHVPIHRRSGRSRGVARRCRGHRVDRLIPHRVPRARGAGDLDVQTGTGLRGDYYTATGGGPGSTDWTFGTYKNTIVDPNIYFDDLTGRLATLTGSSENAAIRWTGNIDVPTTGTYTFNWYGDNGLRLYIDGTR